MPENPLEFVLYVSVPQPFWHQGPILWKKIFPWTRGRDHPSFQDDSNALHLLCTLFLLLLHQLQLRSSDIWSQRLGTPAGHHWPTENQKLYVWLPCSPISPCKGGYWVAAIWIWSEEHLCCVKEVTEFWLNCLWEPLFCLWGLLTDVHMR